MLPLGPQKGWGKALAHTLPSRKPDAPRRLASHTKIITRRTAPRGPSRLAIPGSARADRRLALRLVRDKRQGQFLLGAAGDGTAAFETVGRDAQRQGVGNAQR